jgi:uncharacterized protein
MALVKPKEDPVPVKIERVLVSQQEAVVVLAPESGDWDGRILPVFVDLGQAMNIQVSLEGRMMGRPLTHDLFTNVLNELGAIVDHVVIEDLAQNTFFATLHVELEKNGKREKVTFDARPSDCLALAVRSGAGLLVRRKVLELAAVDRGKFFGTRTPQGLSPMPGEEGEEDLEEEFEEEEEEDEDDEPSEPRRRGGRIDPGEAERP